MSKAAYVLLLLMIAFLGYRLFFEDVEVMKNGEVGDGFLTELSLVFAQEPLKIDMLDDDPNMRMVLVNSFDSLVGLDRDFNTRPSLAVSWGMLDEDLWQFNIRPGVLFHDGTELVIDDVVRSILVAKNSSDSDFQDLLGNISKIEKKDDQVLLISTINPDPLLPEKLSRIFIFKENEDEFIGTGPFLIRKVETGFQFDVFDGYYGRSTSLTKVNLFFSANKNERVKKLLNGEVQFVSSVPFEAVKLLKEKDFTILEVPSLEVQFLIFNRKSGVFVDNDKAKAFSDLVDKGLLVQQIGQNVIESDQFVSSGVFGFDPLISGFDQPESDILSGETLQLHLPRNLTVLGEFLRTSLAKFNVSLLVSYLEPDKYLESLMNGYADLYFLAFKSDLGDATDFFNVLAKDGGGFNFLGYRNEEVEELIDRSSVSLDDEVRRGLLQRAMEIVVNEDVLGVPLFEYQSIYAMDERIEFLPRLDGMVNFKDFKFRK